MMYQDIYDCKCQNTKKNEDTLSIMSNLQSNCSIALSHQYTFVSAYELTFKNMQKFSQ